MPADPRGNAPIRLSPTVEPDWLPSQNVVLPYCTDQCASHDGKRCTILGYRHDSVCEPAVAALVREVTRVR